MLIFVLNQSLLDMAKTASSALFELIHNLTKSEKRYFKMHASRHTIGDKNNSVKIFDFIDQQETFNNDEIHNHFKGEAFLNQFAITKNRLYEQILKALDGYYSTSSVEAQLYTALHSIEILYSKGLYDHAKREVTKAKRLAEKHDKTAILLQIANKEKQLIETKGYRNNTSNDLKKHCEETLLISQQHTFYNQLWQLKGELFLLMNQSGQARSNESIEKYNQLFIKYKALKVPGKITFDSQYLIYHFESAYYFSILNQQESLRILKENMNHFNENKAKRKEYPNRYFSILTNIIHLESKFGNMKAVHPYLNELKALPHQLKSKLTNDLSIKFFSSINSIELKILNQEGQYKKATQLAQGIEEGISKYGNEITPSRKAYLAFNLSIAYFGMEDFNTSLKWINVILNAREIDGKEDIVSFAHLMNLLIHFELNNTDLLPYAIKSTRRFLSKRKRTFQFETIFLKHLTKISNAENRFERERILYDIEEEIRELKTDPFESVAFEYFDFHLWLTAKMKNKPFSVVKREHFLALTA